MDDRHPGKAAAGHQESDTRQPKPGRSVCLVGSPTVGRVGMWAGSLSWRVARNPHLRLANPRRR